MALFVYGTLRSLPLLEAVAGGPVAGITQGALPGYRTAPLPGAVVPMIVKDPGAISTGLVLTDLTPAQDERLDRYEAAWGYARVPVTLEVAGAPVAAEMYWPPQDRGVGAGIWDFTAWEAAHLQPNIWAVEEFFAQEPPLDADGIAAAFMPAEKRAWARLRALDHPTAARVRHAASPGDLTITAKGPPQGEFFRIQAFDVHHRRFDGSRSDTLRREVFVGMEAVLVLPYDPLRDRVLLVEQARMAPALLGDPNPWMLEPVAGMVDARETPEDAAHRETVEEAALDLQDLVPMAAFYPSPGSSTDYFHAYLGLVDLPMGNSYTGGLDTEAEDLRLHVLDRADALALIETGEIAAGPLIMMLYWLDRNRARFA